MRPWIRSRPSTTETHVSVWTARLPCSGSESQRSPRRAGRTRPTPGDTRRPVARSRRTIRSHTDHRDSSFPGRVGDRDVLLVEHGAGQMRARPEHRGEDCRRRRPSASAERSRTTLRGAPRPLAGGCHRRVAIGVVLGVPRWMGPHVDPVLGERGARRCGRWARGVATLPRRPDRPGGAPWGRSMSGTSEPTWTPSSVRARQLSSSSSSSAVASARTTRRVAPGPVSAATSAADR